ncbi:MAG: SgcJ/EcaC family oxidoreductase [Candidatus Korobacteraceae bacterium]
MKSPFRMCAPPISVLATTLLLSMAAWTLPPTEKPAGQDQKDLAAINALSQKDIAACMKNDVDTLCSLWTDDGVLLMPGAAPLMGKKAICSMLQEQGRQSIGSMTTDYTEDWQEVRIVGNYAWQWGKMSETKRLASGKMETMKVNAIRILRREADGSWKVARAAVTPAGD